MRKLEFKCECDPKTNHFGSNLRTVQLVDPLGKIVDVDQCISHIIKFLWANGVKTVTSCCGHGRTGPNVVVKGRASKIKMLGLGYGENRHGGPLTFDLMPGYEYDPVRLRIANLAYDHNPNHRVEIGVMILYLAGEISDESLAWS